MALRLNFLKARLKAMSPSSSFLSFLTAATLAVACSCATTEPTIKREPPSQEVAPLLGTVALSGLPDRNVDIVRVRGTPFVFPKTALFTNLFPPEGGKQMVGFRLNHVASGKRVDVVLADVPRSGNRLDDVKTAQRLLGSSLDQRAQSNATYMVLEKGTACRAPADGRVNECLAWWPKDHLVFILVHDAPQVESERAVLIQDLRELLSTYAMTGLQQ
jgi:hypothetical protein